MLLLPLVQLPAVRLCVTTVFAVNPFEGVNDPVKPAADHAARPSPTVNPTRAGTMRWDPVQAWAWLTLMLVEATRQLPAARLWA